jgi:hypothetical protein
MYVDFVNVRKSLPLSERVMKENDRQKFVRLANARVNKAIKAIGLVGNLSNKSNYAYTKADIEQIFRALTAEIKSCRSRFENETGNTEGAFKIE